MLHVSDSWTFIVEILVSDSAFSGMPGTRTVAGTDNRSGGGGITTLAVIAVTCMFSQ